MYKNSISGNRRVEPVVFGGNGIKIDFDILLEWNLNSGFSPLKGLQREFFKEFGGFCEFARHNNANSIAAVLKVLAKRTRIGARSRDPNKDEGDDRDYKAHFC